MSQKDLWTVIGRAQLDLTFGGQLAADFDAALHEEGYVLDEAERKTAQEQLDGSRSLGMPPPFPGAMMTPEDLQFQKEMMRTSAKRVADLWQSVTDSLKSALNGAARTYKTVTWMNMIMFGAGMGLFIFSAVYGVISKQVIYSVVFAGLGAGTFISLFITGAVDKTQSALSNLVQVEIAFTNYLEQVTFWESYANRPDWESKVPRPPNMPPPPALANIEKASALLHQRSTETIQLLENYVESRAGATEAKK